jgi:tetratricopeptide (TPR) repeat protein
MKVAVQVHNAMGFCYKNMQKVEEAVKQFKKATTLAPGYVTAWNNLADLYETQSRWKEALPAYEAAYELEPENEVAKMGVERLRTRAERLSGTTGS